MTRTACLVELPDTPFVMPGSCACCGADATLRIALAARSGRELAVGYCHDCASHVARAETRRLAARLAALLIGLASCLALSISLPWLPFVPTVALTLALVLVPLAFGARTPRAPDGHAAFEASVSYRRTNELVCARPVWGEELAARLGTRVVWSQSSGAARLAEVALGLLLSAAAVTLSYRFHHPSLRIINLGDAPLEVLVDGHAMGTVEPSSTESPLAGLELRIPAGRRRLVSRTSDGNVIAEFDADVVAGERHLYAPLDPSVCFFLERSTYGRDQREPEISLLDASARFWVVPSEVDGWFVKSPQAVDEARVTGGTTTVLRQAPCNEVP